MTDHTSPAQPKSIDDLLSTDLDLMKAQYARLFTRHKSGDQLTISEFKTLQYLKEQIDIREKSPPGAPRGASPTSPSSDAADKPPSLPNLLRVTEYLAASGYKVKKSAVYKHAARGLIPRTAEGAFLTSAIDTYAAANLKRLDGAPIAPADAAIITINEESARAELRRRIAQADFLERKATILDGSFISRAVHEQERAASAARLKADFDNFIHAESPAMVNIVHGDPVYIPEFVEFMKTRSEAWFARYDSPDEFVVRQSELDTLSAILNGPDSADTSAALDEDAADL